MSYVVKLLSVLRILSDWQNILSYCPEHSQNRYFYHALILSTPVHCVMGDLVTFHNNRPISIPGVKIITKSRLYLFIWYINAAPEGLLPHQGYQLLDVAIGDRVIITSFNSQLTFCYYQTNGRNFNCLDICIWFQGILIALYKTKYLPKFI